MLSRRDKLLIQPWNERRFKDHRSKVSQARAAVDASAPAPRPHVALKLQKCRRELERADKVQRDNYALLQRLTRIMNVNRLDNHWPKPLPNFSQKVGMFYDAGYLSSKLTARSQLTDSTDDTYHNVKCYACEIKKKQYEYSATKQRLQQDSLPSIY